MSSESKAALVPAPDAKRCEAGNDSCGAGQPLYVSDGIIHCEHHASWSCSKEGRVAAATKKINEEK